MVLMTAFLSGCNHEADDNMALLLGLMNSGSQEEVADLHGRGLSAAGSSLVSDGLAVLSKVNIVISAVVGGFQLINLLTGGGATQTQTGASIQEIAALLNQQALTDSQWRVNSVAGQLHDAENVYVRYSCAVDATNCSASLETAMFNNALNLYNKASAVFNDVDTVDTVIGEKKLQLIPVMMEAGAVMIFAQQELGLAEREMGASATDIKNREIAIKNGAVTVLKALDKAEVLLQKSYRATLKPIEFTYSKQANGVWYYWALVKNTSGTSVVCSSQGSFDGVVEPQRRKSIVNMENCINGKTYDYFLAHRYEVFGSSYYTYRQKLQTLAQGAYSVTFKWSSAGQPDSRLWSCIRTDEPTDPHTWTDNYFCSSRHVGLRWSYYGALSGMNCTNVKETADPYGWDNNYVCVPTGANFTFSWSSAGAISGKTCTKWSEGSDPHTWNDNYLCNPKNVY